MGDDTASITITTQEMIVTVGLAHCRSPHFEAQV